MIKEIVLIEIDNNAKLSYLGIFSIRYEDEYGGFRVDIQIKIDNIKEKFHIDIATGDPITPKEINYKYKPIMGDRYVKLWTYNIETVLAEKIETVLSRVELNGRMRDFYDIYLIYTKDWSNINLEHFIKAIEKTFYKREYIGDPFVALNIIKNSEVLKERWNKYQKTFSYVRGMDFDEIMECLEKLIEQLETVGI